MTTIEFIPTSSIVVRERHRPKSSDGGKFYSWLKDDIAKHGLWVPLRVWRTREGEVVLIDGNDRLSVLREVKGPDVLIPVVFESLWGDCNVEPSEQMKALNAEAIEVVDVIRTTSRKRQEWDDRVNGLVLARVRWLMAEGRKDEATAKKMIRSDFHGAEPWEIDNAIERAKAETPAPLVIGNWKHDDNKDEEDQSRRGSEDQLAGPRPKPIAKRGRTKKPTV